jgi:hypothetical protein
VRCTPPVWHARSCGRSVHVHDRRAVAANRIYAAATHLVVRDGLDAVEIDTTLASRVHCCASGRASSARFAVPSML